jgi:hypothetical protein
MPGNITSNPFPHLEFSMNAKSVIRSQRFTILAWCLAASGFLAPSALGAELHGGIEIGAKGVKATVVEAIGEGDDIEFKVKSAGTTNTALAAGVDKVGRFDPKALATTVQAIKKYHDQLRKEFKVAPERIHVVASSGLFAAIADKPQRIEANQRSLSEAVKKNIGVNLTFIDVKREAELSIVGTLPRNRRRTGLLIDIGGGNTKGGCLDKEGKYATFGVPFGTVTFSEFARKKKATDSKALASLGVETLTPLLKKRFADLPDVAKRDRVYLSGGVVWAVTTFVHPTLAKSFTPLTLKEVEQFEAKLVATPGVYPEPDLSGVTDEKARQRALAEVARVKKVYPPEQLLAGIQILKNVFSVLGNEKRYFFARHGYLGWILAYVTESAKGEREK